MNHKKTARFADLTAAAKFYGMGRALLFALRSLGKEHNDTLPVDDPAQMPAWFERMQARGIRRPCPDSVLARASEATTTAPAAKAKSKKAPAASAAAPADDAPPPAVKITLGPEATTASIVSGLMTMHASLSAAWAEMAKAGTQNTVAGQTVFRQLKDVETRALAWQKASADLPRDDKMDVAEVQTAAMEFARAFQTLLRRELVAQFPAGDHEKVMAALDMVSDRLPTILPEALKAAA